MQMAHVFIYTLTIIIVSSCSFRYGNACGQLGYTTPQQCEQRIK